MPYVSVPAFVAVRMMRPRMSSPELATHLVETETGGQSRTASEHGRAA